MNALGPLRLPLVAALVLALDQATKAIATAGIDPGETVNVLLFLDLTNTRNEGVAFGLLAGRPAIVYTAVALALAVLIWFYVTNRRRRGAWAVTGLIVGGAVGNAVDRVSLGYVRDFIQLPSWPAFNVADMAITFGVAGLVLLVESGARADSRADASET